MQLRVLALGFVDILDWIGFIFTMLLAAVVATFVVVIVIGGEIVEPVKDWLMCRRWEAKAPTTAP